MLNNLKSEEIIEDVTAKIMDEMKKKEEMAYEKAIDGYQFLVNRYHTWMNYYSIFTGAFFIALYTVWDKGETETVIKCACCKCCQITTSAPDMFLLYLIIGLGWFSSVCWLASLIGHRAWMGSWLRIVKMWEKKVLPADDFVYRNIIIVKDYEKERNNFCETKVFVSGYISTQQMTEWFICIIIAAWMLFGCYVYFEDKIYWIISIISCLVASWGIRYFFKHQRCCLISDDVKGMIKKQDPITGDIH